MAGIITFSPRTTLTTIRDEFRFTAARLNKHKWTAAQGVKFMEFETRLAQAESALEALLMELEECNAAVEFLDSDLDGLVDMVAGVTGNRRGPGLYRELFGNKRVFEFKRPILNAQLDAMVGWQEILAGRDNPALVVVVQRLAELIPQAEEVQARKKAVQGRLVVFRETGTRAQLIAGFNAARKSIFGELSTLQHEHKQDATWAESFFRQSRRGTQPLTVLEIERRLQAHAEEGVYLQGLHQELVARQTAADEAAQLAAERARLAEIAGKREELARLAAELAELEGQS